MRWGQKELGQPSHSLGTINIIYYKYKLNTCRGEMRSFTFATLLHVCIKAPIPNKPAICYAATCVPQDLEEARVAAVVEESLQLQAKTSAARRTSMTARARAVTPGAEAGAVGVGGTPGGRAVGSPAGPGPAGAVEGGGVRV